jgi:hypothetical protein
MKKLSLYEPRGVAERVIIASDLGRLHKHICSPSAATTHNELNMTRLERYQSHAVGVG